MQLFAPQDGWSSLTVFLLAIHVRSIYTQPQRQHTWTRTSNTSLTSFSLSVFHSLWDSQLFEVVPEETCRLHVHTCGRRRGEIMWIPYGITTLWSGEVNLNGLIGNELKILLCVFDHSNEWTEMLQKSNGSCFKSFIYLEAILCFRFTTQRPCNCFYMFDFWQSNMIIQYTPKFLHVPQKWASSKEK